MGKKKNRAAWCSAHGDDINPGCEVCLRASSITWSERVRQERPGAPDWLISWAATMDTLDSIEARFKKLEDENNALQAEIRRLRWKRRRWWWW